MIEVDWRRHEKAASKGGFQGTHKWAQAALAPSFSLIRADLPLRLRR